MQKGLDLLLTKYSTPDKAKMLADGFVEICGERYPILPWESERRFVELLAKSAVAAGAKVLFFEIHPDPEHALCDGDNMLPLDSCEKTFNICNQIFKLVN